MEKINAMNKITFILAISVVLLGILSEKYYQLKKYCILFLILTLVSEIISHILQHNLVKKNEQKYDNI